MGEPVKPNLCCIISHPGAQETLLRHWPYFMLLKDKFDFAGLGTYSPKVDWPEEVTLKLDNGEPGIKHVGFGTAIAGLLLQEVEALECFLDSKYKTCLIMEYDNVVVRPFPNHPGGMLLTTVVPNYSPALFHDPVYYVSPRWYCREASGHYVHHARDMLKRGDTESWMSDRFASHVCHRAKIPVLHLPSFTAAPWPWWSIKPGDAFIKGCRAAIQTGAYVLHGIKTETQLQQITSGFNILTKGLK